MCRHGRNLLCGESNAEFNVNCCASEEMAILVLVTIAIIAAFLDYGVAQTNSNCTCLIDSGSNSTVLTGSRLVTVATLFNVNSTIETLCPCSCAANCTCSTAINTDLPAVNVYQPYYTCNSTSTSQPTSTSPSVSTRPQTTNYWLPGGTQTYPAGTYATGQIAGSNTSVIISCPCVGTNAFCEVQVVNSVLPTLYEPYQLCSSTTTSTTASSSVNNATDCYCSTSATTYSPIPIGTYFINSFTLLGVEYTVEITCACKCGCVCNTTYTTNVTQPFAYVPYATCSNVSSTASPNAYTTSYLNIGCNFTLPGGNATFLPGTYYTNALPGLGVSIIITCPCNCNNTVCNFQTVSQTLPNTYTPYAFCSTSTTTTPATTTTTMSPSSSLSYSSTMESNVTTSTPGTTSAACVCYTSSNSSDSALQIGSYYLNSFSVYGINYTIELTCDCQCGCICNTTFTAGTPAASVYIPYASCNFSTTPTATTVSTTSAYPNCTIPLAGTEFFFPIGTYYSSAIAGFAASIIISCPCSCNASCTLETTPITLNNTYTPYALCQTSNSTTSTPTPASTTALCTCYTDNTFTAQLPIGSFYRNSVATLSANITIEINCSCECGCICSTTVTPGYLPSLYIPNAFCNSSQSSTTTTSIPSTSSTLSTTSIPSTSSTPPTTSIPLTTSSSTPTPPINCSITLPNSTVSFTAGTYYTSAVVGLNISVIISCPCSCNNSLCSIQLTNQTLATSSENLCSLSTSQATASPASTSSTCQCLTSQDSSTYLPLGTFLSSSVTIGNTNYTIQLSCPCECGCVCNLTTILNSYANSVYLPYTFCPATSTTSQCLAYLAGTSVTFPIGTVMSSNAVVAGATLGFLVECPCLCGATCSMQNFTYAVSETYSPGALCSNSSAGTTTTNSQSTTTYNPFISWNVSSNCSCSMGGNYTVPIGSYYKTVTQTSTTSLVDIGNGQSISIPVTFCIQTTWSCPCNCSSCACTRQVNNLNPSVCPGSINYPIIPYYFCPSTTTVMPTTSTANLSCSSIVFGEQVPLGSTVVLTLPCFQINCTCNCSCLSACPCSFLPLTCPSAAGSYNATTSITSGQCGTGRRKRSVDSDIRAYAIPLRYSEQTTIDEETLRHLITASISEPEDANRFDQSIQRKLESYYYMKYNFSFSLAAGFDFIQPFGTKSAELEKSAKEIAKFYIITLLQHTSLAGRINSVDSISFALPESLEQSEIRIQSVVTTDDASVLQKNFEQECTGAHEQLHGRYNVVLNPKSCVMVEIL